MIKISMMIIKIFDDDNKNFWMIMIKFFMIMIFFLNDKKFWQLRPGIRERPFSQSKADHRAYISHMNL